MKNLKILKFNKILDFFNSSLIDTDIFKKNTYNMKKISSFLIREKDRTLSFVREILEQIKKK